MLKPKVSFIALAIGVLIWSGGMAVSQSSDALSGNTSSKGEGLMEGVLVAAKKVGATGQRSKAWPKRGSIQ